MDWKIYFLCLLIHLKCSSGDKETNIRLPNVVAVVGRSFEYFIPGLGKSHEQYEVVQSGKSFLPQWLSYDKDQNFLHGVPSWQDKGSIDLEVKSKQGVTKAAFSLSVHDLHTVLKNATLNVTDFKVTTFKEPQCPQGLPVATATIIFDLHMGKLNGGARMALMKRISEFVHTDTEDLHMSAGKGHNTAFGLKDVMMITAGPGEVVDAKEPGMVVSWQIGCGNEAKGMVVGSLLKSSSERGAFHHALEAPVSAWHITTGYPKVHPKRERRQIGRLSPTPLSTKKLPREGNVTPTGRLIYATPTPTETVVPPLTIATHISTSLSSHILASTVLNTPPVLRRPIGQLRVYQGQGIRYFIPYNTFYDKEDTYTSNLRLDMRTASGTELGANFWILLNSPKQEIYGMPFDSTSVGLHEFQIIATDTGGLKAYDTLEVYVMEDTTRYNHEFTILFDYTPYSASFMNNVEVQVFLLKTIASYYNMSLSNVRVAAFEPGVSFTFRFDLTSYERCDQFLIGLVNSFWIDGTLSTNFVKALQPEFKVSSGSYRLLGPCEPKDNTPPTVRNPIGQLTVHLGQAIHYQIPYNTFFDNEDFYTPNLNLEMKTLGGKDLPAASWILFNSTQQEIYGMPIDVNRIGLHNFSMVATDKGGKRASNPFSILVVQDPTRYNHAFRIELNFNYNEFVNNVDIQLSLLEKIANYFGVNFNSVRVADYERGLSFTFHFDFIPYEDCKHPQLLQLRDAFWIKNKLNPNFVNALRPEFEVTGGSHHGVGPCKVLGNTPPVLVNPISQLTVQQGKGIHFVVPYNTFYDNEDRFYTPNLNLEMRTSSDTELPSNSWILFNKAKQEIYGLPFDVKENRLHKFIMVASDKEGLKTSTEFEVRVLQDLASYNHEFTILLDYDYAEFETNVDIRLALLDKIANYFGTNVSQLHVVSYFSGMSFKFQFDSIPYGQCNHPSLRKLMGGFWDKKDLNPNFVSALLPEFKVTSGSYQAVGPCKDNTAPEVTNPIKRLNIYQGQALQYPIPYDTFYDNQNSYTPNLDLEMRMSDNTEVQPDYWILLNSWHLPQEIYALPVNDDTVGSHDFIMVATDKGGLEASESFEVQVVKDTARYNHEFTIRLDIDYASFRDNVGARVTLLDKIANYHGVNLTNVRVVSYACGVSSFTYRFDFVPHDDCNHPSLQNLIKQFWDDGELNPEFTDSLSEFYVKSGSYRGAEHCVFPGVHNDPPQLVDRIEQLKVYQGQAMLYPIDCKTFYDEQDLSTPNLKLTMKPISGKELLPSSWILLNSTRQEIYGLPLDDNKIGMHKFDLKATDKGELSASETIEIEVLQDPLRYNHEFTILLNHDYDTFAENVGVPVLLLDKIARYYSVNISNVRVVSYIPGISFNYRFDFVPYEVCNYPLLRKVIDGFWIKTEVNPNFVKALSPEFKVISGSYRGIGPCAIISNDPPELYNHIDRLNVFQGQGIRYLIPNDTFYDKEDMFTPNLVLDMRTINNEELLSTSWILLNSSQQEIYGLPFNITRIGLHQFVLVGMDSGRKKVYDAFEVQVWEDTIRYNHEFAITLNYDNATFMNDVGVRVLLLDKIAIYYGVNLTNVRVVSYLPGVVFTFRFDFVPYEICNHPFLLNLIGGFITNGKLNPNFVNALLPEFIVTSGRFRSSGPCGTLIQPTFGAVGDRPAGVWWTYAIIPAIVLAIVLLLIGCCILLLMGCHRKQKMSAAEKKTFIYKRKPIVLQEEYEVKEHLLKQPLVLPNEKPPVPPMYPQSPVLGGIRSEEKSVAYQAPSFASSRTAAGGGRGGGNVGGFGMGGSGGGDGYVGLSMSGSGGGSYGGGGGSYGGGGGSYGGGGGSYGGGGGSYSDGGGFSTSGGGGYNGGGFSVSGGDFGMSGGGGMSGGTMNGSASMGGGGVFGMSGGSSSASSGGRGAIGSGGGIKQSSYSYSYSSSTASGGGTRKTAHSGYRLPPAYVPP